VRMAARQEDVRDAGQGCRLAFGALPTSARS
jgi:hypothetical protein